LIAYIPTFVKTWKTPSSEDPTFFAIEMLASVFALIAIGEFRIDIFFPILFVLSSGTVLFLIYRKKIFHLR